MSVADPERYNREVIYPDTARINRAYAVGYSLWGTRCGRTCGSFPRPYSIIRGKC